MAKAPPAQLRDIWLEAVLLPGEDDPETSCLKELAEYTGESLEEVREKCEKAVEEQRELWYEEERDEEEQLVAFYNECEAYIYELLWWHALQQGDAPAWNARLVDLAETFGTEQYLDFGGGIGTNAILLGRRGIEVTVADISDVLQEFARWRLDRRDIDGRTIDLKTTDLESERYDLISAVDVLEHVADPIETLRDLTRALRPGGLLVFDLIASKFDPNRPFHLLRSKYPIRSSIRGMGYRLVDSFQKYLVYQKVERSPAGNALVKAWDVTRWRLYYLLQGKWPRGAG